MTFWQPVVKFAPGSNGYEYHCTEIFNEREEASEHGEKVRKRFAAMARHEDLTLTVETEPLAYNDEDLFSDAV